MPASDPPLPPPSPADAGAAAVEPEDESWLSEYTQHARPIEELELDIRETPFTVSDLRRKYERGQLNVAPAFQRGDVWSDGQRSSFIESVLLNIPLPSLYLNQLEDGNYIVVDGRQRLTSLFRFLRDELALTQLARLPWLSGKTFSQLDAKLQARIEDKKLHCHVLKPSVPIGVVYDIFERINTGGTQLTRQEIRNGLFQGPVTALLERLAESGEFLRATDYGVSAKRMKDREMALRCLAFRMFDPVSDYPGDLDELLNRAMVRINRAGDQYCERLEMEFKGVFKAIFEIFGLNALRIPTQSTRGRVNIALSEVIYRSIAEKSSDFLNTNRLTLQENHAALVTDSAFVLLVRYGTGDRRRVKERFERGRALLESGTC